MGWLPLCTNHIGRLYTHLPADHALQGVLEAAAKMWRNHKCVVSAPQTQAESLEVVIQVLKLIQKAPESAWVSGLLKV